jgi:hypothetical protein
MRPVVHGGDAGMDELGAGEPHPVIGVVRRILLAEREHGREVALLRALHDGAAAGRVPEMVVSVDEPGQRDHATAIDRAGIRRQQIAADSDDCSVAHVHVAACQIPE